MVRQMSEQETIAKVKMPGTRVSLAHDLAQLGVAPGMTLLVHSSLSALGWVCGGPVAVIQAFMDGLTPEGTLVMPAHSGDYSDPAEWANPPVPVAWHAAIRETMPAFDPRLTPTRMMGAIAEAFRTWPGARRSDHPSVSFAAWGRYAETVTAGHELDYSLGEGSPLARLYELDSRVLLLGVGYDCNTAFHLAEYRAPAARETAAGAPTRGDGGRAWRTYRDIETDAEPFAEIGRAFEQAGHVRIAAVGAAKARFFSLRAAVDFAQAWLGQHVRCTD
jgi:aminoglycoside 3-N-acetyltransferase